MQQIPYEVDQEEPSKLVLSGLHVCWFLQIQSQNHETLVFWHGEVRCKEVYLKCNLLQLLQAVCDNEQIMMT